MNKQPHTMRATHSDSLSLTPSIDMTSFPDSSSSSSSFSAAQPLPNDATVTVATSGANLPVAMGVLKEIEVARQFSISLPEQFETALELLLDSILAVLNIPSCALVLYTGTAEEPLLVAQASTGNPLSIQPLVLLTDTILNDLLGNPLQLLQKQLTIGSNWFGCLAVPMGVQKSSITKGVKKPVGTSANAVLAWELDLVARYLSPLIPQVLQLRNISQLNQLQSALEEVSRFLVGAIAPHEAIENIGKVFQRYLDVDSVLYLSKNTITEVWEAEKLQGIETLLGETTPCSDAFTSLIQRYDSSLSFRTTPVMALSAQQVQHYCATLLPTNRVVAQGLLVPTYLERRTIDQERSIQGVFLLVRYQSNVNTSHTRDWSDRALHFLEQSADLLSQALSRAVLFEKTLTLASCDELTGLLNRRAFNQRFEQELDRSIRTDRPLAIVIVDVDYFKHFNDTYGHLTGDKVLRALAQLLQSQVRRSDVVCRFGGEEFVFLLPETNELAAFELVDRIRLLVAEQLEITSDAGEQLHVTMSAGISTTESFILPSGEFPTAELLQERIKRLLEQADERLYQAKNAGRNCVVGATYTSCQ
jgi:diguanylate cyclase (GGDEF)-like protein